MLCHHPCCSYFCKKRAVQILKREITDLDCMQDRYSTVHKLLDESLTKLGTADPPPGLELLDITTEDCPARDKVSVTVYCITVSLWWFLVHAFAWSGCHSDAQQYPFNLLWQHTFTSVTLTLHSLLVLQWHCILYQCYIDTAFFTSVTVTLHSLLVLHWHCILQLLSIL